MPLLVTSTDSWGADLHKLMGSTMVCSVLITRWPNYMQQVFGLADMSQEEPYEAGDGSLNLIGRHSQMDKRNNILKFWLVWKAKVRPDWVVPAKQNPNTLSMSLQGRKGLWEPTLTRL